MAESIIQTDKEHCFLCSMNGSSDRLEEHHIFFGTAKKQISEKYGLTAYLCGGKCHRLGKKSVHKNAAVCRALQEYAQRKAMEHYGWTKDDFRKIMGKNYI